VLKDSSRLLFVCFAALITAAVIIALVFVAALMVLGGFIPDD
jgi:ABC-type multidrug transport system permease subunit